jgi:hypothetical protein
MRNDLQSRTSFSRSAVVNPLRLCLLNPFLLQSLKLLRIVGSSTPNLAPAPNSRPALQTWSGRFG